MTKVGKGRTRAKPRRGGSRRSVARTGGAPETRDDRRDWLGRLRDAVLGAVAFDEGQDWAVPEGLYWDAAHGALSEAALRDGVDEGEKKGLLHAAAFAASRGTRIEPDPDGEMWIPAWRFYELSLVPKGLDGAPHDVLIRILKHALAAHSQALRRAGGTAPEDDPDMPGPPSFYLTGLRFAEEAAGRLDDPWGPSAPKKPAVPGAPPEPPAPMDIGWRERLRTEVGRVMADADADEGWRMPDDLFWSAAEGVLAGAADGRDGVSPEARSWASRAAVFVRGRGAFPADLPRDDRDPFEEPDPFDDWNPILDPDSADAMVPEGIDGGVAYVLTRVVRRVARLKERVALGEEPSLPAAPEVSLERMRVMEARAGRPSGDGFIDSIHMPKARGSRPVDVVEREFTRLFRAWAGEEPDLSDPARLADRVFAMAHGLIEDRATDADRAFARGCLALVREGLEADGSLEPDAGPALEMLLAPSDLHAARIAALEDWEERAKAVAARHRQRLLLAETQQGVAEALRRAVEEGGPIGEYATVLDRAAKFLRFDFAAAG